jgi:hypothetical protein
MKPCRITGFKRAGLGVFSCSEHAGGQDRVWLTRVQAPSTCPWALRVEAAEVSA